MVRDAESLKLFRFVSHLLLRSFRRHFRGDHAWKDSVEKHISLSS
jgi:hypothetical protein